MLLQIHHKATSQSCPIIIKLFRGLLITLADSCSCLICDSIWHFSRICFSFPQGSQPFAESAVMVSNMFQASTACTITDLTTCLPATHKEQPRHNVICSSLLLSWCFSFCNVFYRRRWPGNVQCTIDCLVELVETNHTSPVQESIFTNLQGHIQIFSHVPQKKGLRTHRIEQETMFRQESSKSSFLPNVCGVQWDPQKSDTFCWKNEKRKISESINMPGPAASSASSVASASASLAWGFYSWSGATCRLQKKKCPNHLSPQLLAQHLQNPCFSTYPSTTSHDMWCNTIILGIYIL